MSVIEKIFLTVIVLLINCNITAAPVNSDTSNTLNLFSGDLAMGHLVKQVEFGPRLPGSPGIMATRDLIKKTLNAQGFKVGVQNFKVRSPLLGYEVEGENIFGVYPKDAAVKYIISAHYDSRPYSDQDTDAANHQLPVPGANDGASGVAVLLELARCLPLTETTTGVALVFFDLEDHGAPSESNGFCLGSKEFARALPAGLKDFEFGVNLDMVGDANLSLPMEGYSLTKFPKLTFDLWRIGKQIAPQVWLDQRGPSIYDDHLSFLPLGKPYIDVIDFDYPHWHTTDDTPDKCSAQSLDIIGDTVLKFILH